jgi:hypothetical protein
MRTPKSKSITVTPRFRGAARPGLLIRRPCISTLVAMRPIVQLDPTTA